MATFKNVKENENAVDLNATNLRNDGTIRARPKSLFNDGVNKNRADNKQLSEQARNYGQRLQQPDTTAVSVSDSASAEFNSFNHLKHLKPTCTYKVDYFITAPILTHAASVLRKAAFGDVSDFIKRVTDRANKAKEEAVKKVQNKVSKDIELGVSGTAKSEAIVIPPEQIQYDFLNIPWTLRVPDGREEVLSVIGSNTSSIASAEQEIVNSQYLKDISPSFTVRIETGKDADACPKSVTHKGFKYVGSIIKPLYIPIHPADSYGGMFGKLHAEFRTNNRNNTGKVNTISAIIINRVCVPNKFEEPEGSLPITASLFSDYASIVSPPMVYGSDSVTHGKNDEILFDDVWKNILATGALFTNDSGLDNPPTYSNSGLKKDDIIKHGTDGITKGELTTQLAEIRSKLTSPFLRRLGLAMSKTQKAGQAPGPYDKAKVKDYSKLAECSVEDTLQGVTWDTVVSNRYKHNLNVDSIKTGKNFYDITDIPAFNFWSPWISSKAEDSDGSTIYSHLPPETDKSLSSIKVIFTKKAPIALLEAGVNYVPYTSYINSIDDTDLNPGFYVDENVSKYGIGGFGNTSDSKDTYLLPVSNLTRHIFTAVSSLFSDPTFPVTHKYGKKEISIHSAVLRALAKSFSQYSFEAVQSIKDAISINILYSKYKGKKMFGLDKDALPNVTASVKIGLTDILLFGTSFETTKPQEDTFVFVDENQKNLLGPDKDKTYNKGQIGKLIRVDINKVNNVEIHFGKTINQKGIEDNVKLKSSNVKKFLIDSGVTSIPITDIASGQKSIITDIQPGEEILQKEMDNSTVEPAQKLATKLNEIQYSISPSMAKTAMYTEDLIDQNENNRVGALDIIASLMGSGYSDDRPTDFSSTTSKPVTKDIDTLLNVALQQSYTALMGRFEAIPKMEPFWKPKGLTNTDSPIADPYVYYTGVPQNQFGILSSIGSLLFSPEIFYIEHFEDVKKNAIALNNIVFYTKKRPDNFYGISFDEEKIPTYINISDIKNVTPITVNVPIDAKASDYTPESTLVKVARANISYSPWTDFEVGKEDYVNRINKFSILSEVDNERLISATELVALTNNLVNLVEAYIQSNTTPQTSLDNLTLQLTSGEFAITESNVVSKLTSLLAHRKFENISKLYPGSVESLINTVFKAIGPKITAKSIEGAILSAKKIKDSDETYSNFVKFTEQKKAEIMPLIQGPRASSADINSLVEVIKQSAPKTYAALKIESGEDLVQILLFSLGSILIKDAVYSRQDKEIVAVIDRISTSYKLNTQDTTELRNIPRYEVVSLRPLAELIEVITSNKNPRDYREITRLYKEVRLLFTDWYAEMQDTSLEFSLSDNGVGLGRGTPYTTFSIPKSRNLTIPMCIVSEVERSEDNDRLFTYEFPELGNTLKLVDFAKDILDDKYKLLVKKLDIKWLDSGFLSGELNIERVSNSLRHASVIVNLIDYIGFTLQTMFEVEKVRTDLGPGIVESNPLTGRKLNKAIRKKKIELGSEFTQDDSSELEGSGVRRYLVKLTDFTNLVNVKEIGGTPQIIKMFPMGLKDLDPDKQDISLEDKNLVETKVISLNNMTGATTKYIGMFLRPGYGVPDFAEKVGYRCKIEEVSSVLFGKFKPKRYAFFGLFKQNQASLKLSRMIESASGERFADLVKASDWTTARIQDKETVVEGQLSSFDINAKYKSSYDGFVPKGMKGTILYDIEIGYVSTRPLFSSVIRLSATPITTSLVFGGVIDSVRLKYKDGFPINMVGRLLTGKGNTPAAKSTNKATNELYKSFMRMISANKDGNLPSQKESTMNFSMLSMFRIPTKMDPEDMQSLDSLFPKAASDSAQFNTLKDKVVQLINSKKLRDSSFDPSSQFCFNGRVFENAIPGSSPYPVFFPGAPNVSSLPDAPSINDYKSIERSGLVNEALYDLHPLSFLTSPTFIGLSKRRSLLTGSYMLANLIQSNGTIFVKKPGAKNPYAGLYYTKTGITHNNIATNNNRVLSKTKNVRIVLVPDFPETKLSASSIVKTEYGLSNENVSDNYLAEFFGTGSLLNGKFVEPSKFSKGTGFMSNNPVDASGQTSHDYKENSTELFTTLLEHLKLWSQYSKHSSKPDLFNALNGSIFFLPSVGSSNDSVIGIVSAPPYNKMVGKSTVSFAAEKDRSDFVASIPLIFQGQTKVPVALKDNTFYFTASAITFISLLTKNKKDKSAKIPENLLKQLNTMMSKIKDTSDPYWKGVIPYFERIDLFSIMAGGRYNFNKGSAVVRNGGYSSYTDYENNKNGEYTRDSARFVAAQSYMGYSTNPELANAPVQLAITKGGQGRNFLTPTRTFGLNIKLTNIIQDGIKYSYMQPGASTDGLKKKNSKGNANAKLIEMAKPVTNTLALLYDTHAFNIFSIARLWLAYNWYSDSFSNSTVLASGSENPIKISDATLYNLTSVDISYFVKNVGPVLKNVYSRTNVDARKTFNFSEITDSANFLNPVFTMKNGKKVVSPMFDGSTTSLPSVDKNSMGVAGILNAAPKNEQFVQGQLSVKNNDLVLDTDSMNALWSLFSMKVFVGTNDIGINISAGSIVDDVAPIKYAPGDPKPSLGSIDTTQSKVYTDMRAADKTKGSDNFITIIKPNQEAWGYVTYSANNEEEKFHESASQTEIQVAEKYKSKKLVYKNGLALHKIYKED